MTRRKYEAALDADASRVVMASVTAPEHEAIRELCPERGAISELVRGALDRVVALELESCGSMDHDRRHVGAQLAAEQISGLVAAANACGLEPTVLLRLVTTARARTGTGEALYQALRAARR